MPIANQVHALDSSSPELVELVAQRMRITLIEVLGKEDGTGIYTLDWLRDRVLWHLSADNKEANVFLAKDSDGRITGQTIIRIERDESVAEFGLFSTIYVEPEQRRNGVASGLIEAGETWFRQQGMTVFITNTSKTNQKLINLFAKHGYRLFESVGEMVRLGKGI